MELNSAHRRYLDYWISLFALNSQSHWLIFAKFGNLCRFFEVWLSWKKLFREIMYHKNSPEVFGSGDIFRLKKYLEFKWISQIFKIQFTKPILKHVTSKFIVQKQQFWTQLKIFLKTRYINGSKIFRGTLSCKLCTKNFWGFQTWKKKHRKFKIVHKWPFPSFAKLVAKFWNKNNCKLDKNPRNFSLYQK